MASRRPGDKPLSEPMVVRLPTHICVTRPQWVKPFYTHITHNSGLSNQFSEAKTTCTCSPALFWLRASLCFHVNSNAVNFHAYTKTRHSVDMMSNSTLSEYGTIDIIESSVKFQNGCLHLTEKILIFGDGILLVFTRYCRNIWPDYDDTTAFPHKQMEDLTTSSLLYEVPL